MSAAGGDAVPHAFRGKGAGGIAFSEDPAGTEFPFLQPIAGDLMEGGVRLQEGLLIPFKVSLSEPVEGEMVRGMKGGLFEGMEEDELVSAVVGYGSCRGLGLPVGIGFRVGTKGAVGAKH